jgi:nitroimidazol reductase NimA-like FMN-containing flavoprotein (pyridoxamine 5'-phosphate oxidase superfamily)
MKRKTANPKATRPQIPGYGLPRSKKGLLPWRWAERRLTKSHEFVIATVRPDRRPHMMVIWALWLDGKLYFSTGSKSRKAQNLAKNPNCVVCTEDAAEAVIVEGVVRTERSVERIQKFLRLYEKKYEWDMSDMADDLLNLKEPVFFLQPRKGFGLWEKKFATTATRWLF